MVPRKKYKQAMLSFFFFLGAVFALALHFTAAGFFLGTAMLLAFGDAVFARGTLPSPLLDVVFAFPFAFAFAAHFGHWPRSFGILQSQLKPRN